MHPLGFFACSASDSPLSPDDPQSLQGKIPLPDLSPAEPYEVMYEAGIPIVRETDPEGARLFVNIYRPAAEGPFPVLLQAIAYRREFIGLAKVPDSVKLAEAGYVVILMDIRGTGSSEGTWGCFSDDEVEDVAWIIDHWIPAQPWSNGKVGLFGPSYMGIIQMLTAARKPAHLKAIFPGVSMADAYRDSFYQGGIFDQEFIMFWALATASLSLLPSTEIFRDPFSALTAFAEHLTHIPEMFTWLEMTTDQAFFTERSPMFHWDVLAHLQPVPAGPPDPDRHRQLGRAPHAALAGPLGKRDPARPGTSRPADPAGGGPGDHGPRPLDPGPGCLLPGKGALGYALTFSAAASCVRPEENGHSRHSLSALFFHVSDSVRDRRKNRRLPERYRCLC